MKTLVVARFEEDISWLDYMPSDWERIVVQKGRELPNEGREASSYTWAILRLYDRLADDDLVAFVQGDPFVHCADIRLDLLLDRPTDGYRALGEYTFVSGGNGHPHHDGIPVAEMYEKTLDRKWPGVIRFAPGAQFVVTGRDIKRHSREFYESLLVEANKDKNPWVLERLWPAIFAPQNEAPSRVTFYCQATPVTTYLRCELPARYLPGKVMRECPVVEDDKDFWFPLQEGKTAVFQFAGDANWALMVHGLQHKGHRVMMEADDNYFAVAPSMKNTGWGKKKNESAHSLEGHADILKWMDGCIVTTDHLASVYRKRNANVYVCPNTVDPIDWPEQEKPDDGIFRIGWFASNSHAEDAKLVARGLEWASRQKDVEVVTMGLNPSWWGFRRKHNAWQDLPGYREAIHELDVGVAPVVGTPWALCRSDLKALEYTMGGAAPLLSDVAPYSPWSDGETCLKARDAKGFYEQIRWLVQNRDEAKALARSAKDYVLSQRTTQAQVGLWEQALEGVEDVRRAA